MSNPDPPTEPHAPVVLDAGAWRLVFAWHDDRWQHRVEGGEGVLESCEGSAADPWPSSPPWQSLHVEPRGPGRQVAFLVGMAGASHWSASVEVDAESGRLVFDVACRAQALPARLGSSYALSGASGGWQIEPLEVDGIAARLLTPAEGLWRIEPSPTTGPWPQTIRWRYAIRG